jgi:hypothetical protein
MVGNRAWVEGCIAKAFTPKEVAYFSNVYFVEQHLLVLIVWSLGMVWYTIYLFACISCFRSLSLGAEDFENLQELDV